MNTLISGIAGFIIVLFALGFLAYSLLGESGLMGLLTGKNKVINVALLVGAVLVLAAAVIGFFRALLAGGTADSFLDRLIELVMASFVSATTVAGGIAILFAVGFLAYVLLGDEFLAGVLSGKVSPLAAGLKIGGVILIAAVAFGVYTSIITGGSTGGSFFTQLFDNIKSGIGLELPANPPTPGQ